MKPRTAAETAITTICATGLIAPALLLYGLHDLDINGRTVGRAAGVRGVPGTGVSR
jgi:hypothetical protein